MYEFSLQLDHNKNIRLNKSNNKCYLIYTHKSRKYEYITDNPELIAETIALINELIDILIHHIQEAVQDHLDT